jgi:hypothetical protein
MLRNIVFGCISVILVFIVFNRFNWKDNMVFLWDQSGYYRYLPAVVIYDDLGRFEFSNEINHKYETAKGHDYHALYEQAQTGRRLNKYSVGVCLFEAPAFFLAHGLTLLTQEYPPDGFSTYYRLFVALNNVFWVLLGLWIVTSMLFRYYSERVAVLTILMIAFGTNLYHYTVWDAGMSHPYSFFLMAALLDCTDRWYRKPTKKWVVLIGLIYGLLIITRPTNAVAILIPLFWTISKSTLNERITIWKKNAGAIFIASIICFAVLMIQCSYWKYATGSWVYYSYEGEGFDFFHPKIFDGLLSFRKGWFLYTPMALLAVFGLIPYYRRQPRQALLIFIYTCLSIYIAFSWTQWYYGGSFGCRALIENYALLSLPLAALVRWAFQAKRIVRSGVFLVLSLCLSLNLWQTYQYNICVIPFDGNTAEYYKRVFFKENKSAEDDRMYHQLVP